MALKQPTAPPTARARAISSSIASGRAVVRRCEARLDTSSQQVLRADAIVRRVRVYLEAYDRRYERAAPHPISAEDRMRRRR